MKRIFILLLGVCIMAFANIKEEPISSQSLEGRVVIDVRTPQEWKDSGVIKGSKLITFVNQDGSINDNFLKEISDQNITKDDNIAVVCRSGARSKMAAEFLDKNGFNNVTTLNGGVMELQRQNFPLQKIQ